MSGMIKTCSVCGIQISGDMKFCSQCGAKVSSETPPTEQPQLAAKEVKEFSGAWLWGIAASTMAACLGFVPYLIAVAVTVEMDLRTLKKNGFVNVRGWRWIGLLCPIAYVALRIKKTTPDIMPEETCSQKEKWLRFAKRYAPVIAWIAVMVLLSACAMFAGAPNESSQTNGSMNTEQLAELVKKSIEKKCGYAVKDITLFHDGGNRYHGIVETQSAGLDALLDRTHSHSVEVTCDGKNLMWKIED